MSKNKNSFNDLESLRMVYSTNPDAMKHDEPVIETPPANKQTLKVRLDKKQRRGKTVTIVGGFVGNDEDLETLTKTLKTKCGVGGSAKEGEIILQGDFKEKIVDLLKQMGYEKTKGI